MKLRKSYSPFALFLRSLVGVHLSPKARCRGSVTVPDLKGGKKEGESTEEKPEGEETPGEEKPEGEEEKPASEAAKPSIFDKAAGYLKSKEGAATEIAGLKAEKKRLEGLLEAANKTIGTQNAELVELRAGKKQLEAAINGLEAEKKTVGEAVVDVLAGSGVPQVDLPAGDKDAKGAEASTDAEKLAHYGTLSGKAKTAYFRANKQALLRAESAAASQKK